MKTFPHYRQLDAMDRSVGPVRPYLSQDGSEALRSELPHSVPAGGGGDW
jgi:hypothetical protein